MAIHNPTLRECKELIKKREGGERGRGRERAQLESAMTHQAQKSDIFSIHHDRRKFFVMSNYKHACYYGQCGQATVYLTVSL